jgi:class 3 adenylate cyclase
VAGLPETRYASTPFGHLAYQVTGAGAPTIVYMTGTVSHVEIRWEIPYLVRLHRRLMAIGRVVTFDPLGLGASDPLPDPPPTLDEAVAGYLQVLDAVGAERAVLVATNHGVAAALAMAADHPERVEKVVALGGYARLFVAPDYPEGADPASLDLFIETFIIPNWGSGVSAAAIHGVEPDEHELAQFARLERAAAAPGAIERLLRWITTSDVRDKVARVQQPVLVFGLPTQVIRPEQTAAMVAALPDARFIDIGHDPVASGVGLDEVMTEIAEFITGSRAASHADRKLAAVLFTDVVGSTARASEIGDRQWRDELEAFRIAVRREIDRHGGREVNTRGDDFLVVFDRASSAIECAQALTLGRLQVRSGVHVGEVEVDGDDLAGVAVHVGARVAALAGPGEILVTTAVRQAVAGMNWRFADRGVHELRGVPDEWQLFAVEESPSVGSVP